MEALYRCVSGIATALALLFAPIGPPVACTLLFMAAEFAARVAAERLRDGRGGQGGRGVGEGFAQGSGEGFGEGFGEGSEESGNGRGRRCGSLRAAVRQTAAKALLATATLVLCYLAESCILGDAACPRTRLVAGFACGIELWSFLEHAAALSDAPLFRLLRKRMKSEA